jgi:peptidyl-prolyl cis-trans isomerase B (cyclophilin B)
MRLNFRSFWKSVHEADKNRQSLAVPVLVVVIFSVLGYLLFGAHSPLRPSKPATAPLAQKILLETGKGQIEIELLSSKAPKTVANFIALAQRGFYDGTKFHRIEKGFMIQGGDPFSRGPDVALYGRGGPGYTIPDEISDVPMVRGVVAMANYGPNTNGSQFFILTREKAPWLQGSYTIFGKVTKGMDVVDAINQGPLATTTLPIDPVVLEKVALE